MPRRGPGSAQLAKVGRASLAVVAVLAAVVPAPSAAVVASPTAIAVAPTCVTPGAATRVVILGIGWPSGPVALTRLVGNTVTNLGTATPRTSPVRQEIGSFSFTTTVTADVPFQVVATQGELVRVAVVAVQSTCPPTLSVPPGCVSGTAVQLSGAGFFPGQVPIEVDPFGDAETLPLSATAGKDGTFSTPVPVTFKGGPIPIIATRISSLSATALPPARAVVFVEPCPPPSSTSTTTRNTDVTPGTTAPKTGPTTTTLVPPGGDGPVVPPVGVPTPGATAKVSISPSTVRPGRCAVLVVSAAPAALPVVARFADRPAVNSQTGPDGGAVLSLCHSHDSGVPLGPVKVLIGIGPLPPAPVFTVLRVPPRPQPPMLQSGADGRRS